MDNVSKMEQGDIPFCRRFTLDEIWAYLAEKYPEKNNEREESAQDTQMPEK